MTRGPMVLRPSCIDSGVTEPFNAPPKSAEIPPVPFLPAATDSSQNPNFLAASVEVHSIPLSSLGPASFPQATSPPPSALSTTSSIADVPISATEESHRTSSYKGNKKNDFTFPSDKRKELDGGCDFIEKLHTTTAHHNLVQSSKLSSYSDSPSASRSKASSPSPFETHTGISSIPSTSAGTSVEESVPSRWDSSTVDPMGVDNFSDHVPLPEDKFIAAISSNNQPISLATSPSPAPIPHEMTSDELLINFASSNDESSSNYVHKHKAVDSSAPPALEQYSWDLSTMEPRSTRDYVC